MDQTSTRIRATHHARKAIVYVRQSSEVQVRLNQGSTEAQRDQRELAQRLGWPEDAIEVVDDDLGLSGAAVEGRAGYQRIVKEITRDDVGGLFITDVTRAGRSALRWQELIELCRIHDTLLVVNGRVYDLRDPGERLLTSIVASVGEHENEARREMMQRARLARARSGHAVTQPPCGYVRAPDGGWVLDPDPSVQSAIRAVFRTFMEHGSLRRTVVALNEAGVQLPRRGRYGLRWTAPLVPTLANIIKHPVYKGDYVFRRHVSDLARGRDAHGRVRQRRAAPDETVVVRAHHDPYVSEQEWEACQAILRLRAPSKERRNLGPGSALCQGIVRCSAHHDRAMAAVYKAKRRDGGCTYGYWCQGDALAGGRHCGRVAGPTLDAAVVAAVLERLVPARVEEVQDAFDRARADECAQRHRSELDLKRAKELEADLEYRYRCVDPANRFIAADLEKELNDAKARVRRLKRGAEADSMRSWTEDRAALDELAVLSRELETIWGAATTENQDRKEIIRTMVRSVRILERSPETVRAEIVWADAAPPVEVVVVLFRRAHRIALELAGRGVAPRAIAAELNDRGLVTQKGRAWTMSAVRGLLRRRGCS